MAVLRTQQLRGADQANQSDRLSATLRFDDPVNEVSQVSQARATALKARGISTVRDLLNWFPRRYIDMTQVVSIAGAHIGSSCTIVGRIHEIKAKQPKPRLTLAEITLVDNTGTLIVTCFNQPWLAQKLNTGETLSVSGTVEFNYGFKRMTNPLLAVLDPEEAAHGVVQAIHSAVAKQTPAQLKRYISNALGMVSGMYDPLPLTLRTKYRLPSRYQAYRAIHEPRSMEEVSMAHRRLLYEELLFLQLSLLEEERARNAQVQAYSQACSPELLEQIKAVVPFELTEEQSGAVDDILSSLAGPLSSTRLLLGDVGTGKTIVSLFGLVVAAKNGHQAVMVGPTEILVRQYARVLGPLLDALDITWAVLTGTTPAQESQVICEELAAGQISVCFGTHALFEPGVQFASCSFVCFDEQQRFGVDQRESLLAKAPGADVLSMTATPIPRSLALALYGNTALSYLHAAPFKKATRTTKVLPFTEVGLAYDAIRTAFERGEQAYVVCPLIGVPTSSLDSAEALESGSDAQSDAQSDVQSDTGIEKDDERIEYAFVEFALESDLFSSGHLELGKVMPENGKQQLAPGQAPSAAAQHAEILQNQVFPQARVALLHGRLPSQEKTAIIEAFSSGEIDVLVSTTIVEVGVDVPNATVMIIEDADRFGLAQLHQLRGRVGRGQKPGEIFLVTRSKAPTALERLRAMEQTEDGFKLSEIDLAQRKEGDIFGARQHGKSPLRLVNVMRDSAVIEAAFNDAKDIVFHNRLTQTEKTILQREVMLANHE